MKISKKDYKQDLVSSSIKRKIDFKESFTISNLQDSYMQEIKKSNPTLHNIFNRYNHSQKIDQIETLYNKLNKDKNLINALPNINSIIKNITIPNSSLNDLMQQIEEEVNKIYTVTSLDGKDKKFVMIASGDVVNDDDPSYT